MKGYGLMDNGLTLDREMNCWMDGWMDLLVLDGEVDGLRQVGVVHRRQDHGENVGVHLRLVLRVEVLVAQQTLHPVQRHEDDRGRT